MSEKPLVWLGDSRETVSAFADDVRKIAGFQLRRVLYVARFAEAVYVLHAFEKRAPRTPKGDVDLARQRLRWLISRRARAGKG